MSFEKALEKFKEIKVEQLTELYPNQRKTPGFSPEI